jgi:ribose/xylose/arabinose/galactoside ABC-type transport system permease subunit
MGRDLMMNSIAAVVIGGTQLTGGVGGPIRTIFGVILIAILGSGMNFMGLTTASKEIATGIVMIAAVAANMDRSRMPFVK